MYQRPACSTFTFTYIRCGYTGHFYRGKWPFYCGNLAWCVWPGFPEINLPWKISMVTSKRRKKPAMTFNVVSSKQGFLDSQGKRANQVSSFDNMKPPKNILFFSFFFCVIERNKRSIELVCWARFRNDISTPKKLFYSWHVIEQWDPAEL